MASESWMALPLFNRQNSPASSRNVLLTVDPWPLPTDFPAAGGESENLGQLDHLHNLAGDPPLPPADSTLMGVGPPIHIPDMMETASTNPLSTQISELEDLEAQGPEAVACPFPGCKSTLRFTGTREFRRHYKQHFKRFFCRYLHCPQTGPDLGARQPSNKRGFATRKDRARHEAKHDPSIQCPCLDERGEQCPRMFSRFDNMRDHVRRIHRNHHYTSQEADGAANANRTIAIDREA
ncbi:hypothetical protein N7449_011807 [Penicillium cf. viridicatum]|uniref:C2H2-type domain-containing protein n=1 Tax=Penicillium cf. viridicatum TaxID=2972119 RepID=A0A9W9LXW6_9EURO|nr:hypothetical protein N7449_011807 [Penicillium cf. viridicatum]